MGVPFLYSTRLFWSSTNTPDTMRPSGSGAAEEAPCRPTRRTSASTRASSSLTLKGFVI